jgi:ABC-type sulfate transport system permease subunit
MLFWLQLQTNKHSNFSNLILYSINIREQTQSLSNIQISHTNETYKYNQIFTCHSQYTIVALLTNLFSRFEFTHFAHWQ